MIVLTCVLLGSLHLAAIIYQNFAGRNSSFCTGILYGGLSVWRRLYSKRIDAVAKKDTKSQRLNATGFCARFLPTECTHRTPVT